MKIQLDFNNIKVKEHKKDFTVKILMLKGEKGDTGDLDPSKIVDNLTSTDSTKVLSAKQGKALKDLVDKKPYFFDTVADMKAGDLNAGDYVITKGYYSVNDGGNGEYTIVNDSNLVDDGGLIHELSNDLFAKLIVNGAINIKQLGAKGDGTTDDSPIFNKIKNIDYAEFYIPKGKYLINSTIDLKEVNGKHIYGCGKEGGHNNEENSSIIIGNTGNNPIFNLIGALTINIEYLNIISYNTLNNPSSLGIIQGVTTNSQYSQWIEFNKLFIDLLTNTSVNDGYGSIGIYNWQSELNNYTDLFIHCDTPAMIVADDVVGLATNNGGIRPNHDSLTGNQYTNLELQSRNNYALVLSGQGLNFNNLYLQQALLLLPNQTHDNQNNNLFIQGIIENTQTPIILENGAKLGGSNIQLHTVQGTTIFSGNGIVEKSIINISGSYVTNFSDTNIRFSRCIIFRNGKIKNLYSQGNIILNNSISDPTANSNLALSGDGVLWYNGKAVYSSDNQPSRNDLPNGSIALNTGSFYNFFGWKYKANESAWIPMGISRPVETDTGTLPSITPIFRGELLHNVTDDSMWIAYGTSQGNWKKITDAPTKVSDLTNDSGYITIDDINYDASWVYSSSGKTLTNFNALKQYIYGAYATSVLTGTFKYKKIVIKDNASLYEVIDTNYIPESITNITLNETITLYTRNKTFVIERDANTDAISVTIS